MISSNDLKPGNTILVDNEIYVVLDISQNKPKFVTYVQEVISNYLGVVEKKLLLPKLKNAKCSIYMIPKILWFSWIMKPMIKLKFPVNV